MGSLHKTGFPSRCVHWVGIISMQIEETVETDEVMEGEKIQQEKSLSYSEHRQEREVSGEEGLTMENEK